MKKADLDSLVEKFTMNWPEAFRVVLKLNGSILFYGKRLEEAVNYALNSEYQLSALSLLRVTQDDFEKIPWDSIQVDKEDLKWRRTCQ